MMAKKNNFLVVGVSLGLLLGGCEQEASSENKASVVADSPSVKASVPSPPTPSFYPIQDTSIPKAVPVRPEQLVELSPIEQHKAELKVRKLKQRRWWDDPQFEELNLDLEQTIVMESHLQFLLEEEARLKREQTALRRLYREAVTDLDFESATNTLQQQATLKCRNQRLRISTLAKVLHTLTPDQKNRLAENPVKLKRVLKSFNRGGAN